MPVDPEMLEAIRAAMREVVGEAVKAMAREFDVRGMKRPPRDRTATERQRRRRALLAAATEKTAVRAVTKRDIDRDASEGKAVTKRDAARDSNGNYHLTTEVWASYSAAYQQRYHTPPVRNAKTNAQVVQLVKRVGAHAIEMASWFLTHGAARYVSQGHSMGMLLMDAEKLHTEWETGRRITATAAQQSDRTQATGDVFHKLIEEVKRNGKIA